MSASPRSRPWSRGSVGRVTIAANPHAPSRLDARSTDAFASLRVSGYPFLLLAGWFWNICRWGCGFLGAYIANKQSGSARLVQLSGVVLWAPLLLGGVVGGMVSDRFDRRRTVIAQFLVVIPLAALLGLAGTTGSAKTGNLRLWMVYGFLVVVGIGWLIDMTSRRAIIYDLVGQERLQNAMALEAISSASGLALGSLVGGTAVQAVGVGAAFYFIAGLLGIALGCFLLVPRVARGVPGSTEAPMQALRAGFRLIHTERRLVSVLGITATVNFFAFSFTPLVQVVGSDFDVGPFLIGLLASMTGFGMMFGSMFVARTHPHRRGRLYVIGAATSMLVLVGFAGSPWYLGAIAALLVSASGMGLFSSTQSTLVMTSVAPELRGRALGLLSTAIGVLPIGMIALGELAQRVGARWAIGASVITGLAVLGLWLGRRPEVLQLTA